VSPHSFQIGQRVIRARRLLEAGMSAAEAAVMTGFVDQSHLHRHFTRRLGITPGRYARAFASNTATEQRAGRTDQPRGTDQGESKTPLGSYWDRTRRRRSKLAP
jgi:AraC-like DNA-binding protein